MNKFKLRIYYEGELVARWMVDEKQKRLKTEFTRTYTRNLPGY